MGGFFMTIAFVLGNGVSRQSIDPSLLASLGSTYGCNAIFREFAPSVLISTDVPISKHIQQAGYSQHNVHYTRKPMANLGSRKIPQKYYGFSSGPVATAIAALDRHQRVYLVGFDMGPTPTGQFNNMYAGTEFYKKPSASPTYTGNWVRQLISIAHDFPRVEFVRVQGPTTASIPELSNIANFTHMPMADFFDRINNTKDL
jgi:hypothetical protein